MLLQLLTIPEKPPGLRGQEKKLNDALAVSILAHISLLLVFAIMGLLNSDSINVKQSNLPTLEAVMVNIQEPDLNDAAKYQAVQNHHISLSKKTLGAVKKQSASKVIVNHKPAVIVDKKRIVHKKKSVKEISKIKSILDSNDFRPDKEQEYINKQIKNEKQTQALAKSRNEKEQQEIQKYAAKIKQHIEQQWLVPNLTVRNLEVVLLIHVNENGDVLTATVEKTSRNALLDRSALTAVYKSSPLPMPESAQYNERFREIRIRIKPEDLADEFLRSG
ncbi:MAG: cell envelope integrity protein TolA [Gammaproteobacteria bacterium]|nr:cell envelope integrity protein TolA [Gammaproteobacteria bacterium]